MPGNEWPAVAHISQTAGLRLDGTTPCGLAHRRTFHQCIANSGRIRELCCFGKRQALFAVETAGQIRHDGDEPYGHILVIIGAGRRYLMRLTLRKLNRSEFWVHVTARSKYRTALGALHALQRRAGLFVVIARQNEDVARSRPFRLIFVDGLCHRASGASFWQNDAKQADPDQ